MEIEKLNVHEQLFPVDGMSMCDDVNRYLDRVIQGSEAEDILSACDEMEHEVTIRGNLRDAFKRRNVDALKDMAIQQITDLAVQGKLKKNRKARKLECFHFM